MENVKENLIFSLDVWPETGVSCDFALSPSVILPYLTAGEEDLGEVPNILTSLRGHLDLQLAGKRLLVKGNFAVKTEMMCSRCLSNFIGKVGDTIDEVVELGRGETLSPDEDPESFIAVRDGKFDLSPLIAELFWLSWPVRAICRPDCKGLCPGCGANLNDGTCLCHETKVTRH
ncbi:MAG: DUF177 domain-containing protein [Deltaproteobacteria bacterium]|nr:DUF177 domain-containing protein [Deltaproteobacteria bacterium]